MLYRRKVGAAVIPFVISMSLGRFAESLLCRTIPKQSRYARLSRMTGVTPPIRMASSSKRSGADEVALEIEQKFSLMEEGALKKVKNRLLALGFSRTKHLKMVDWYFDLEPPRWALTPQDYWLRFREEGRNSRWQLKRGFSLCEGATIYEELQGDDAFGVALSILSDDDAKISIGLDSEFEGHSVPQHPIPSSLVPFARIVTHRSSWEQSGERAQYSGLNVDLDATQYGYMVGEVEYVVDNEELVDEAHQRVKSLLSELVPGTDLNVPAIGKLETYLMKYRPAHYEACVNAGSVERR